MAHVCVVGNDPCSSRLYMHDPHGRQQAILTRDAVCRALLELGHSVTVVDAGPLLLERLGRAKADVIFNLATGLNSKKDQANIAAMLELSGVPFTGSTCHAHILGLHKHLAKMMMGLHGIPTPRFRVVTDPSVSPLELASGLDFPVIVKPAAEGSSAGISRESVALDPESAVLQVRRLYGQFGPAILVEEFIDGREFTVGLVGYPYPAALPVEEIVFQEAGILTYDVKTRDSVRPVCPANIPEEQACELQDLAKRTFRAIGCRDLARVDIRVSRDGKPYVLEINTLPGLMPGYSEMARMAEQTGMAYAELVRRVLDGALFRRSAERECTGTHEEAS